MTTAAETRRSYWRKFKFVVGGFALVLIACALGVGPVKLDTAVAALGVFSGFSAAYWWLRAALIEVPDNVDTFIEELHKAGIVNAYAAAWAVVASLCAAYVFFRQL